MIFVLKLFLNNIICSLLLKAIAKAIKTTNKKYQTITSKFNLLKWTIINKKKWKKLI